MSTEIGLLELPPLSFLPETLNIHNNDNNNNIGTLEFASPLSYSRSISSQTPHHSHSHSHIQEELAATTATRTSTDRRRRRRKTPPSGVSRMPSLSSTGTAALTPRSILSNPSTSMEDQQQELHDLMVYIDGLTFCTPLKPTNLKPTATPGLRPSVSTPARTASLLRVKPPRPITNSSSSSSTPFQATTTGRTSKSVLGDRTNNHSITGNCHSMVPMVPGSLHKPMTSSKSNASVQLFPSATTSTVAATPPRAMVLSSRQPQGKFLARDPTPRKVTLVPSRRQTLELLLGKDIIDVVVDGEDDEDEELVTNVGVVGLPPVSEQYKSSISSSQLSQRRGPYSSSCLMVELSRIDDDNDEEEGVVEEDRVWPVTTTPDPPVEDGKVWSTSSTTRLALDPEPTARSGPQEASILLGTAFADADLNSLPPPPQKPFTSMSGSSPLTTHFDEASYVERQQEGHEYGVDGMTYDAEAWGLATPAPPMTTTPTVSVTPTTTTTTTTTSPRTPKEAKEWLQTAVQALQEAQAERAAARQWAQDMQASVERWADQQRQLIATEAASRYEALQQDHVVQQQIHTQALQQLQTSMQTFQDSWRTHHQQNVQHQQTTESSVQELLLDQQEKIQDLCQQLASLQKSLLLGVTPDKNRNANSNSNATTPTSQASTSSTPVAVGNTQPRMAKLIDPPPSTAQRSVTSSGSARVQTPLPHGKGHVIRYSNGVQKEVHIDGTRVVRFTNGDTETTFGNTSSSGGRDGNTVAYWHAQDEILQLTRAGITVWEYPNRQIERHYPDGSKAILFPNGTKAKLSADGVILEYTNAPTTTATTTTANEEDGNGRGHP